MLVKVNNIDASKNKVKLTKLDIDDYGSTIQLDELELKLPQQEILLMLLFLLKAILMTIIVLWF
jgi:hypothetical protein